jgi:hypothetical protein
MKQRATSYVGIILNAMTASWLSSRHTSVYEDSFRVNIQRMGHGYSNYAVLCYTPFSTKAGGTMQIDVCIVLWILSTLRQAGVLPPVLPAHLLL